MVERFHFKCLKDTREVWYYDTEQGVYLPDGEIKIQTELEKDSITK
jgi:hypothetical protein